MKRIFIWLCLTGISLRLIAQAQTPSLEITTQKTTSLVFPKPVRHVDRGSKDILVQQVREAENILLVKASAEKFTETNLSVITADGKVYAFVVNYESSPASFIYHIPAADGNPDSTSGLSGGGVIFKDEILPARTIETYAKGILDNPKQVHGIKDNRWEMKAAVTGMYIKEGMLFIQLSIDNFSSVNYDIDLIRFGIRDQKRSKRVALQERGILPVYITGNKNTVEASKQNVIVFALPKFTIPEQQYLSIEINEKNGGRHLSMKISNNKIIRAKRLPTFE